MKPQTQEVPAAVAHHRRRPRGRSPERPRNRRRLSGLGLGRGYSQHERDRGCIGLRWTRNLPSLMLQRFLGDSSQYRFRAFGGEPRCPRPTCLTAPPRCLLGTRADASTPLAHAPHPHRRDQVSGGAEVVPPQQIVGVRALDGSLVALTAGSAPRNGPSWTNVILISRRLAHVFLYSMYKWSHSCRRARTS